MNGRVYQSILRWRRDGNLDDLLALATVANTPEAQKLLREAIEREGREALESKEFWQEFVRESQRQLGG